MDDTERKLIFSILSFLNEELSSPDHDSDSKERLEVLTHCLENVYGVSSTNPEDKKKLYCPQPLLDIFSEHVRANQKTVSEEDKVSAEKLKNEGNELMKNQCFNEAIVKYTEAIGVDPNNAVYYSNRAAAHSKNSDHQFAIKDCQAALAIDSNYSKAYGRMGLAYTEIKQYDEAIQSYTKALEFDPSNESYKINLGIAQDLAYKASARPPPTGPTFGGVDINQMAGEMRGFSSMLSDPNFLNMLNFGGIDSNQFAGQMRGFDSMLSDPTFLNMATKLMANPEVANAMSSMMQQSTGGSAGNGHPPNMNAIMQMGLRLTKQMERENPEQLARLREQFGGGGGAPGGGSGVGGEGGGSNFPDQSPNGNADGGSQ